MIDALSSVPARICAIHFVIIHFQLVLKSELVSLQTRAEMHHHHASVNLLIFINMYIVLICFLYKVFSFYFSQVLNSKNLPLLTRLPMCNVS